MRTALNRIGVINQAFQYGSHSIGVTKYRGIAELGSAEQSLHFLYIKCVKF
jgi:hypothetical protein